MKLPLGIESNGFIIPVFTELDVYTVRSKDNNSVCSMSSNPPQRLRNPWQNSPRRLAPGTEQQQLAGHRSAGRNKSNTVH